VPLGAIKLLRGYYHKLMGKSNNSLEGVEKQVIN
jgi:hypothetical protein